MAVIQPFDPLGILMAALFNPVVILVALWLGWQADQWSKALVAGFAAAIAGAAAIWLATAIGLITVRGSGGEAGVFVASFIYGCVLAAAAYGIRQSRSG